MSTSILNELNALPSVHPSYLEPDSTVDVSLIIPARNASESLQLTVQEAHRYLSQKFGNSFEIILVPNPAPGDTQDQSIAISEKLSQRFPEVKSYSHLFPPGKGAAIRTGMTASSGQMIFFTDSDLPYELDFFDLAFQEMSKGVDLVTGNRRLSSSVFHIPVRLLPLAYGRHRLGLAFNRVVRFLLPLNTTDTQAGIKAFSRKLMKEVVNRQVCPGFLFDLEIFLTAHGHGYSRAEFPVTLHLNSEKSTVRVLRECFLVGFWLSRITWRNMMKAYSGKRHKSVLTRFRNAPWNTRFFLTARWKLTPYSRMAQKLPLKGRILDLGCGHGLFALAAALQSSAREILGIDHDSDRIHLGLEATKDLPNIQIQKGDMTNPPVQREISYSGISLIDVMHYFEPSTQELILKKSHDLLGKGGTLIVREVDPEGGIVSRWNRLYEKIATGIGFTQANQKELHFRTRQEWMKLMENCGYQVRAERCSSFLFADILYICERKN